MKKHLLILFAAIFIIAFQSHAQYANTAINTADGRVTTTYEIQNNVLYYHVRVTLPDTLYPEVYNDWDQENQAQFWLYVPSSSGPVAVGFEYCFTVENSYFPGSDPNVVHTVNGTEHTFSGQIDLSGFSSQEVGEMWFQTGLCVIEPSHPYYYNVQQVGLDLI